MSGGFWLTVTDGDGVLLGRLQLDGRDLTNSAWERAVLGEDVQALMGTTATAACAALPRPEED